jgi:NADP-dependent 3-hydroxy acid dehydrogenase YdfG
VSTLAVIGAGTGLGAAVARRFGREGWSVALVSRTQEHLDELAATLGDEGVTARGYAADVRDGAALAGALTRAADELGPVEAVQFSPLPAKSFLKPVLDTTQDEYADALAFSVHGLLATVHAVLPGMREAGTGSVLLVNGGTAVTPKSAYAGTSVAFAGESALAQMLHDALANEGIRVAQLVIPGAIEPGHPRKDPEVLADTLWQLHREAGEFRVFADDPGSGD